MEEKRKKKIIKISIFVGTFLLLFVGLTYAFTNPILTGTKKQVLTSGTLNLELLEDENNLTIQDAMPMYDEVGMIQAAFTFRLINKSPVDTDYILKLEKITVENPLDPSIVKYGLTKDEEAKIDFVSNIIEDTIDTGTIKGNQTIEYSLRLWIDANVEDENLIFQKNLSYKLNIEAVQTMEMVYQEGILNGCDPVLSDNLIPVVIEEDGTVKKADVYQEWYSYTNQRWANAVVLEDKSQEYTEGQVIPEENIQSYFVWIPRYKYKLFDMGNYGGLTNIEKKEQIIEVVFESKKVTPSVGTKVGDYHSHPAFQAFDSNGFWVGKFESGYRGATSTVAAQQNNSNSANLIIKPNVYSWRNINVGNAFKVSYDYLREDESHMMKNTEWGAVAYLQHSSYGSHTSVRVNNNNSYMTGYASVLEPALGSNNGMSIEGNFVGTDESVTRAYNTEVGYTASTTGNISGVYDMSSGAWEYVMGYNIKESTIGATSGLTRLYSDFFTNLKWEKYYDKYTVSSTAITMYNARILGDATGEMGPFASVVDPDGSTRNRTSWYRDFAHFISLKDSAAWFMRGGNWYNGVVAGIFAFGNSGGDVHKGFSFRVVLSF